MVVLVLVANSQCTLLWMYTMMDIKVFGQRLPVLQYSVCQLKQILEVFPT